MTGCVCEGEAKVQVFYRTNDAHQTLLPIEQHCARLTLVHPDDSLSLISIEIGLLILSFFRSFPVCKTYVLVSPTDSNRREVSETGWRSGGAQRLSYNCVRLLDKAAQLRLLSTMCELIAGALQQSDR